MILIFFMWLAFSYCNSSVEMPVILVKVKGLPTNKIYLTSAFNPKVVYDSALFNNNEFVLSQRSITDPDLLSIRFFDSVSKGNKIMIITNEYTNSGTSGFMPETEKIVIVGTYIVTAERFTNPFLMTAKEQNKTFLKYQNTRLWEPNNFKDRNVQFLSLINKVKENSFSFYVLNQIANAKESFTKNELSAIYDQFDENVRNSPKGHLIKNFINSNIAQQTNFSNITFASFNGQLVKPVDDDKLTLIIFWASWCGPCREEIPLLKKLRIQFNEDSLKMISVSIDENREDWIKALKKENMSWSHATIPAGGLPKIKTIFRFSAIPIMILADKNGEEIARIEGFESSTYDRVKDKIQLELKKNKKDTFLSP